MRIPPASCLVLCSRFGAAACIWLTAYFGALAQPNQFGFDRIPPAELSAPQVDIVSGPTASRLEQARALVASKNWEDAIDILQQLSVEETSEVVEVADDRFVSLRMYCHLQLAQLPAEALAAYRRRVDPLAERWYRDGRAARDEVALRRVVDELFCSSWGDDTLLVLGEMALERADYAAARRDWEQTSPLLRDPVGGPMWLSLRDIDLDAHWPQIVARWQAVQQPATWLAYPDTELNLADIRARLILVSIRAGDFQRAEFELEIFRRFHPNATGRLGGQEGPYVAALESLLEAARGWPAEPLNVNWSTFAGSQARVPAVQRLGPVTGPAWARAVSLSPTILPLGMRQSGIFGRFRGGLVGERPDVPVRESQRPLSFFPVAAHGTIFYSDATQIYAVDLQTGRPTVTANGVLYREDSVPDRGSDLMDRFGGGPWPADFGVGHGVPRHTLTVAEDVLYARTGRLTTSHADGQDGQPADRLVGLNLQRDGALAFREHPEDATWSFDGAPVGEGGRIWVAMRRSDVMPHAYVACFDAASGDMLWRTKIGASDTPGGAGNAASHNLLTLVGERIYFNTNLGLIAALDSDSGEICWLRRYERSGHAGAGVSLRAMHFDRDPSPCLVHRGLVIVAPADTPLVFALDSDTGQTVWASETLPDVLHLLGIVRSNLIVSGNRLWALDLHSGKPKFVWPDSEHAGIRGMGRGLVAGDEVFWPTRNEIYVIHGVTGARSRPPIPLGAVSDSGANLAAGSGRLIVAGYDKLMAFGPALPVPPNQREPKPEPVATSYVPSPRTGRLSNKSKNRNDAATLHPRPSTLHHAR